MNYVEYYKRNRLLKPGSTNAKTSKSETPTAIMYMSPYKDNDFGRNVCSHAKTCMKPCLSEAGRGKFSSVRVARRNKTNFFFSDKRAFLRQLNNDLERTNKRDHKTAVRMNGTSDLDFVSMLRAMIKVNVFSYENLQFYDYTKNPNRVKRYAGTNYLLTFSYDGQNWDDAVTSMTEYNTPVSVVFNLKKGEALPKTWRGFDVVDGDVADDIMIGKRGKYILGLRFKGTKARLEEGIQLGFVVDSPFIFNS